MKNEVIIFLGILIFFNGYAQFGEQQVIATDGIPYFTSITDLDGDGDKDVLSASAEDNILSWYKNLDGQGTFGEQQIIDNNFVTAHDSFASDMDSDGDKDIVLISRYIEFPTKLAWYENIDGLGTFGEEQIISIDEFNFEQINPADIDSDGDVDIVATVYRKLIWFENINDQNNFIPRIIFEEEINDFKLKYNLPIDIDNDGDMDVISGGYHDNIEWYENLYGLGTFGEEQIITIDNIEILKEINAADIDGDGDMDVLSASRNDGKIAWYENTNGLGDFGEQQLINGPDEFYGFSVVAADIDNDGDMDVVSGRGDDYVSWYENLDGLGNFSQASIISTEIDGVLQVITTDINNDGYIDIVSTSYWDHKIAWYENIGNLSVQESGIMDIVIFPNPVSNSISIKNPSIIPILRIEIFDILGRTLFIKNNPSNQINISSLTDGLLFVQFETEKGIKVEKIIKQ